MVKTTGSLWALLICRAFLTFSFVFSMFFLFRHWEIREYGVYATNVGIFRFFTIFISSGLEFGLSKYVGRRLRLSIRITRGVLSLTAKLNILCLVLFSIVFVIFSKPLATLIAILCCCRGLTIGLASLGRLLDREWLDWTASLFLGTVQVPLLIAIWRFNLSPENYVGLQVLTNILLNIYLVYQLSQLQEPLVDKSLLHAYLPNYFVKSSFVAAVVVTSFNLGSPTCFIILKYYSLFEQAAYLSLGFNFIAPILFLLSYWIRIKLKSLAQYRVDDIVHMGFLNSLQKFTLFHLVPSFSVMMVALMILLSPSASPSLVQVLILCFFALLPMASSEWVVSVNLMGSFKHRFRALTVGVGCFFVLLIVAPLLIVRFGSVGGVSALIFEKILLIGAFYYLSNVPRNIPEGQSQKSI